MPPPDDAGHLRHPRTAPPSRPRLLAGLPPRRRVVLVPHLKPRCHCPTLPGQGHALSSLPCPHTHAPRYRLPPRTAPPLLRASASLPMRHLLSLLPLHDDRARASHPLLLTAPTCAEGLAPARPAGSPGAAWPQDSPLRHPRGAPPSAPGSAPSGARNRPHAHGAPPEQPRPLAC
nr:WAS/WASL-interacting protein family member 3-like [Aegilops tauschii subsp. strangulata]